MKYHKVLRFTELPEPDYPEEPDQPDIVKEYDEVFERLADSLGNLYLIDDKGGLGPENAPISMSSSFTPCKHHTIVAEEAAWSPDVISVLCELLQELPEGWTFGIDATEFPLGQAHIVVDGNLNVFGYAEFSARSTLDAFGFPSGYGGVFQSIYAFLVDRFESVRGGIKLKRLLKD